MFATAMSLGGCVVSYVDETGGRRIVGLADVEVRPADGHPTFVGDVVSIRGLGLALNASIDSSNVTLGYVRETTALLRDCAAREPRRCSDGAYSRINRVEVGEFARVLESDAGDRRYTGFVDLRVPAVAEDAPIGGTVIDVESYGVSLHATPLDTRLSLGVTQLAVANFGESVVIFGDPFDDASVKDLGARRPEAAQRVP